MALALIDADSIYFRAAYVTKRKHEIRKLIRDTMKDIEGQVMAQAFEPVDFMVAVKGRGNFRKDLYPEYKKNRKDLDDDMKEALNYAHGIMVSDFNAVLADGMEADDLCSIWAYESIKLEQDYTIVGIDKDLLQIPGRHYNFKKREFTEVNESDAHLNLMLQCLTGDSTDNIPGIKGIGPKKASKILAGVADVRRWSRVRAAWRAHGAGNPELSWRLLAMLKSFEEFEDVKAQITGETPVSEQNVGSERQEDIQE